MLLGKSIGIRLLTLGLLTVGWWGSTTIGPATRSAIGETRPDPIAQTAEKAAGQQQYPEAIRLYQQVLTQQRQAQNPGAIAQTLWRLGSLYQETKEYAKALTHLEEADKFARSAGNTNLQKTIQLSQRISRLSLGSLLLEEKQYDKAMAILQQTVALAKSHKDRDGQVLGWLKIGEIYRAQQQYPQAIPPLQAAAIAAQEDRGNTLMQDAITFVLGRTYDDLSQYDKAIALYQATIKRAETEQDVGLAAMVQNNLGTIYQQQGLYPQAQALYDQSLKTAKTLQTRYQAPITPANLSQACQAAQTDLAPHSRILKQFCGNKDLSAATLVKTGEMLRQQYLKSLSKLEANIINNLGITSARQGHYAEAIAQHEQAIKLHQSLNETVLVATSWNNIGNIYANQGEYPKALDFYQRSLKVVQAAGARDLEATTLNNIAQVYQAQGDFRQAIALCQQGLTIVTAIGNLQNQATILNNLSNSHASLAEYDQANTIAAQALAIYQKLGDRDGETTAISNIATIAAIQGDFDKATMLHAKALKIAQEIGDRAKEMSILSNIGRDQADQGQYAKAFASYDQAIVMSRQLGIASWELTTLSNQADAYRTIGRYDKALALYQQATQQSQKLGEQVSLGFTLVGTASTLLAQNQPAQAQALLQTALKIQRTAGARRGQIYALRSLSQLAHQTGDQPESLTHLQQALKLSQELGLPLEEGLIWQDLGQTQLAAQQYPAAQASAQKAIALAQTSHDRTTEAKALTTLGAARLATQQAPAAEAPLQQAIALWESTRPGLTDRDKVSLAETQGLTYRLLQRSLVAQNKSDQALEIAERGRGRAFVELFASRIGATGAKLAIPNRQAIQTIAREQNATLVQYSLVGDRELYIWVVKPTGQISFHAQTLPANLPQMVEATRNKLGNRSRAAIRKVATQPVAASPNGDLKLLHQILIAPIAADLPQDANQPVIIVPQGALFMVPFAALEDAQGKVLIEQHTIAVAPALQSLELSHKITQNRTASQKQLTPQGKLIVGNPTMPSLADFTLNPLPGAEQEAKTIAQLLTTQPLIGDAATKSAVTQRMQTAQVIHLATHGLLDTFRGDVPGAVVLAAGRDKDGLLTAGEIAAMKLTADLMVLSACSTGKGDITGDGVIGLSRAIALAGVPSVIVSLWDVDDASTAQLMTEFYRNWQERKLNKAQALRQAMLTTRQSFRDPWNWAAFNLIGESK
jgi:CHAT domain-containing protein